MENKTTKPYTAAESYLNLIHDLIGSDEKNVLADKITQALGVFYYRQDFSKIGSDIFDRFKKDRLEELYRILRGLEATNPVKSPLAGEYSEQQLQDRQFVTTAQIKDLEESICEEAVDFHNPFQTLPTIISHPSSGLRTIPKSGRKFLSSIVGSIVKIFQHGSPLTKKENVINPFFTTFFENRQTQYDFLTQVFPAVLDDYLTEIGEDSIKKLNEKQNEIQRILIDIHNQRGEYLFNDNEVSEITEQVQERCSQIQELILKLNNHITKLEKYKNQIVENLSTEKVFFSKAAKTKNILADLERIGVDIDTIESKSFGWAAIIDNRFTDLAIEGGQVLDEAKFLIESTLINRENKNAENSS